MTDRGTRGPVDQRGRSNEEVACDLLARGVALLISKVPCMVGTEYLDVDEAYTLTKDAGRHRPVGG
mgnify:CR=1 FL=1